VSSSSYAPLCRICRAEVRKLQYDDDDDMTSMYQCERHPKEAWEHDRPDLWTRRASSLKPARSPARARL
jgi:hypothetical protein